MDEKFYISNYEAKVLEAWNEFYLGIDIKVVGYPIWADEFNKKYKIIDTPKWKEGFILKNRELYKRNKKFINKWLKKYDFLEWINPHKEKWNGKLEAILAIFMAV
ncbi:hypothetical protein BSPWISOXPB_9579 [uncultured Gammaproteobacteria bacterium]|nr:hypothetical protein BSPWISOXPB_9579 [uncultured Gammaproteobacteria bacterium]